MKSRHSGASELMIPPDTAVCDDCLQEMRNPNSRYYRYPFVNCTQCGPRYSIIRSLPYDRMSTSMRDFEMCTYCKDDYGNVRNRRFHAEPIACKRCGPRLMLIDTSGNTIASGNDAITLTKRRLKQGAIVAVKGIGGYHLACDALSSKVVRLVRQRKRRPSRPLAVMASSLAICEMLSTLTQPERELLTSPQRPIVVTRLRSMDVLPTEITPHLQTIGLMLPYTPLHHLLLEDWDLPCIVMTSANSSGLPILYQDEEALSYLATIADYILTYDREIVNPIEDSVVQWKEGRIDFLRRGRGYVPDPALTSLNVDGIVALGGQQKNAVAFGRSNQLFLGPPSGDLGSLEMEHYARKQYMHYSQVLGVTPHTAAVDLHPGYNTLALTDPAKLHIEYVQHHHAHHVSCMIDNGLTESCYGLILDGTGYGTDGCIWGFELLYGNASSYERLGHLRYTPLPGGEASIKQPWRTAVAMVLSLLPDKGETLLRLRYPDKDYEINLIGRMIQKNVNVPLAGTCGRLFDAVSSLLGLCDVSTYEGEAAILLAEFASFGERERISAYPYTITAKEELLEIDFSPMFEKLLKDILHGIPTQSIALRFHETVAKAAVNLLLRAHEGNRARNKQIVLSGGSWHNRNLSERIRHKLEKAGYTVLFHRLVPCDDGGIAQGQLAIAAQATAYRSNQGGSDKSCV